MLMMKEPSKISKNIQLRNQEQEKYLPERAKQNAKSEPFRFEARGIKDIYVEGDNPEGNHPPKEKGGDHRILEKQLETQSPAT